MAATALSAAFLGACKKEVEPTAPSPAQHDVGARIKAFIRNAAEARQGTPKDGDAFSVADAVWDIEAGLNYAAGDYSKAYNDLDAGSLTVPLSISNGLSTAASVFAAFNTALDALAPLTTEEQHVLVVDVVEPEAGANELLVNYQIGSGYEKVNNPPNSTYTVSHWWGNPLGSNDPCDCTGNLDPNRRCANKEIEYRMNAANFYALQPGEYLTDVETWTVRDQTTNTALKRYSYLAPLLAGPAPLGDGHRDTKTFYARSNSTPTEPNCLPTTSMQFWTGNATTGTWSAVMAIRNLHCPTKRFLSSSSEAHGWYTGSGSTFATHRLHRWWFTYGIIQAGSGSYAMRVLGFALLCCSASTTLCQWQLVASGDQLPSAVFDGCALDNGDLAIATNTYSPPAWLNRAFVVHISTDGAIDDSVALDWPDELAKALHIYRRSNDNGFYITGYFSDSTAVNYENQCFVGEVADGNIEHFRHGGRWHGGFDGLGFVDADGSLVYGYFHFQDFWTLEFTFRAVRHCPGIGACDSVLLNEQVGTGRFHAMVPLGNGNMAALSPKLCSTSPAALQHLNASLDSIGCYPVPIIGPGAWNTVATFDDNLAALVLASGNLLVCGTYNQLMQPDPWNPVAVQRLTPEGELLAIRKFYNSVNPAITMRPGIMRGMSAFDEGTFVFAYADNAWQSGPWPYSTETSNIHVLKMDTALNILGAYVFNGDAINRFHFLSSVVASPDGAVYVVGSVYDHDADDPMPKAWVARIGPEQFVSVPEATKAGFTIFPNPGSSGFNLRMANPIDGTSLRLHDAQGRILREQLITEAQTWFDAEGLPAGLYLSQVTARDGSRFTAKWLKE